MSSHDDMWNGAYGHGQRRRQCHVGKVYAQITEYRPINASNATPKAMIKLETRVRDIVRT